MGLNYLMNIIKKVGLSLPFVALAFFWTPHVNAATGDAPQVIMVV